MLLPKVFKGVPSAITLTSLCLGLWSIRFAINGQFTHATICILICIALDGMDGKLARYLKSASNFGATLDTLADFASFGIAPSLLTYFHGQNAHDQFLWSSVLFFTICNALRLARFTAMPTINACFFTGIPAPAGALIALTPTILVISSIYQPSSIQYGLTLIVTGLLLISRIPTFAVNRIKIPSNWMPSFSILLAMSISTAFFFPWHTILLINAFYLCLLPISLIMYRRN